MPSGDLKEKIAVHAQPFTHVCLFKACPTWLAEFAAYASVSRLVVSTHCATALMFSVLYACIARRRISSGASQWCMIVERVDLCS